MRSKSCCIPSVRAFTFTLAVGMLLSQSALGSDGGASVYPAGADTVMPGRTPTPGNSTFMEFTDFYVANALVGSNGRPLIPGFHLRVSAVAPRFMHNWGVRVLGGTLVSSVAVPFVDIHLSAPFGTQNRFGVGNADISTMIAYKRGALSFWYGAEIYPPGLSYNKSDLVHIGQHNFAAAPSAAFSYMPDHGKSEVSVKSQYIVNKTNDATQYRSGNEFLCEYDGMRNVTKNIAIGGNGYVYQQTTNDLQNGLTYLDGHRGRDLTIGPELRWHMPHWAFALKYQKDFLVQNRPAGNAYWFELAVPMGHHE